MLKRLRLRFVFVTMVITSLMLCILLGLVMHFTKNNLERQSVELVRRYALAPQPPALPELGLRRNDAPCIVLEIKSSGSIHIHSTGGYDLSDRDYLQTLVIETLAQPEETGVLKDYLLRYYRINTPSGQRIAYADISQETDTITISEADLKKIFARFYRVNPSRSRDGSYGLGLSIAERIIHDHKGKIWAESRDGINRFHIELPSE